MKHLKFSALEAVARNTLPPFPKTKHSPEALAQLLFAHMPKLGTKRLRMLFKQFQGEALWHLFWVDVDWAFTHFKESFSTLKPHLREEWKQKQQHFFTKLDALLALYAKEEVAWLSYLDARYPLSLKEIHDAPALLFYKGDPAVLSLPILGIVGTRQYSAYGEAQCQRIVAELRQSEVAIVSGLALGIDGIAHEAALANKLPTIGVLAGGLNEITPQQHLPLAKQILAEGGLLLAEMPLNVPPIPKFFPRRNRIITGLSQALWVVEGTLRSGTMVSARLALEESRDVMVLPADVDREQAQGPLKLLKEGAIPISEGQDIIDVMHLEVHAAEADAPESEHAPSPREEAIEEAASPIQVPQPALKVTATDQHPYLAIFESKQVTRLHGDAFVEALNVSPVEALTELTTLEMEGKLLREAGNIFAIVQ